MITSFSNSSCFLFDRYIYIPASIILNWVICILATHNARHPTPAFIEGSVGLYTAYTTIILHTQQQQQSRL